jgi:hypothetical protein
MATHQTTLADWTWLDLVDDKQIAHVTGNHLLSNMAGACIAMHHRVPRKKKYAQSYEAMVEQVRTLGAQILAICVMHAEAGRELSPNLTKCLSHEIKPIIAKCEAVSKHLATAKGVVNALNPKFDLGDIYAITREVLTTREHLDVSDKRQIISDSADDTTGSFHW